MSTTVQTGWLYDYENNKFSPKTLFSQVINPEGMPLDIFLENMSERIANLEHLLVDGNEVAY